MTGSDTELCQASRAVQFAALRNRREGNSLDPTTLYRIAFGDDKRPDRWQMALATDAWPRVLVAPTGSGKTAAVTLGWAAHRLRSPEATPRRLVWCLQSMP